MRYDSRAQMFAMHRAGFTVNPIEITFYTISRKKRYFIKCNTNFFEKENKMTKLLNLILYAILPAILIFSILYFVEHNRVILLLGIYPACLFYALGLCAYYEKHI